VPAAIGLFLLTFADAILTARSYAGKHGQHVDAAQEMVAFAGAGAAAGLSQGFPVGASGSRTAVSDSVGVRTQVGALLSAGVIVVILLLLTEPIGPARLASTRRCGQRSQHAGRRIAGGTPERFAA
jgi:sulfate permease, SulP family